MSPIVAYADLAVDVLALGVVVAMMIRNNRVYRYRMNLLERIFVVNLAELARGRSDGLWRYDELDAVSYDRMVWCFWRRLASFYDRDPARLER